MARGGEETPAGLEPYLDRMQGFRTFLAAGVFLLGAACARASGRTPDPVPVRAAVPSPAPAPAPTAVATPEPSPAPAAASKKVSFAADVAPILARCQPCHFPGGKMYDKLPFDKPETVYQLGTKLFTRIQGEEQQQVIRAFLAQAH